MGYNNRSGHCRRTRWRCRGAIPLPRLLAPAKSGGKLIAIDYASSMHLQCLPRALGGDASLAPKWQHRNFRPARAIGLLSDVFARKTIAFVGRGGHECRASIAVPEDAEVSS